MVLITTITLTLLISSFLILIGFLLRDEGKALFLSIGGGVILIILSLDTFTESIAVKTGTNSTASIINNVTITKTDLIFSPITPNLNLILSWTFLLIGLLIIIVASIMVYNKKYEEEGINVIDEN